MIKHLIVKNEQKTNTKADYFILINQINVKYLNKDISYNSYIKSLNMIHDFVDYDKSIDKIDKNSIHDFIKYVKGIQ